MNEFDFPFFSEYIQTLDTVEQYEAFMRVATFLEENKLLGINWIEYKLNHEKDIHQLTGVAFTEAEWCVFMAAISNSKLKERMFSPYSFTVV